MPQTKVVFSPCLFELMSSNESKATELAHLNYLQSLLDYLVKLNVEFELYENAPYYPDSSKRPPITRYHYFQISYSQLYAKIQKKIAYNSFVLLNSYSPSEIISEYTYPDKSETKDSFLRYITYLQKNSKKSILFIGEPNSTKKRPFLIRLPDGNTVKIMPIYEPDTDCSGQIGDVLPIVDNTSPFPNGIFCYLLNNEFMQKRSDDDKISLIRRYGSECASRNGYIADRHLSFLNSKKQKSKRDIFKRKGKNSMYLSLDFESGGFELFDHTGTHLGQFSFAGNQVKCAEPQSHRIYFS